MAVGDHEEAASSSISSDQQPVSDDGVDTGGTSTSADANSKGSGEESCDGAKNGDKVHDDALAETVDKPKEGNGDGDAQPIVSTAESGDAEMDTTTIEDAAISTEDEPKPADDKDSSNSTTAVNNETITDKPIDDKKDDEGDNIVVSDQIVEKEVEVEQSDTCDNEKKPEGTDEDKKADPASDSEDDDPPPMIKIRDFSEIKDDSSDDEDEVVFVGEEVKKSVADREEEERQRRMQAVLARLKEISTTDCSGAGIEMECCVVEEVLDEPPQSSSSLLNTAASKLTMFVRRNNKQQQPPPPVFNKQQQAPYAPPPPPVFQQQQQQQQRPNWQHQPLNNGQQRMVWGGQQQVRAPAAAPGPRFNASQQPQQQQYTQLIFDPNTGMFLCPALGNQQVLQQAGQQPAPQFRLQNGVLVQQPVQQQQRIPPPPPVVIRPQQRPSFTVRHTPPQPRLQYRARNAAIPPPPPVVVQQRLQRPQTVRQPPPPPVQQRVQQSGVIPVRLPTASSGSSASPAAAAAANPPPKGTVTAGNQKPIPGTVNEADADLQNKTFPSLVVHVKTCLGVKGNKVALSKARSELDASVKSSLMNTPAQFTEWLMRKGVLRLDHFCDIHNQPLKLGMYSDTSRQPFSGGYVWTSDCCGEKQVSVFNGSIFEGSKYPPGTVLKLIYHWACQTPANNVLQWVKVSSLYLKNFFTLLRAVCIGWLHESCPPLGGEMRYVEIGVITLGSSAETSRGVKNVNVEILGVFDPATKVIRMKVINSMQGLMKDKNSKPSTSSSEQGARAFQILWPLTHWVDKRSILLIDGIIDKALFHELGFKNIQQCGGAEGGNQQQATNMNVMNYLRNLVPKMFSSTLSVLSKSIVQQFLDELSWREAYGQSVLLTYENMLDHIGKMTKWEQKTSECLITRLNKINQNPFLDWSNTKQVRRCPMNTIPLSLRNEPGISECIKHIMKEDAINKGTVAMPQVQQQKQPPPPPVASISSVALNKPLQQQQQKQKKDAAYYTNMSYYKGVYAKLSKNLCLQVYYYGRREGGSVSDIGSLPIGLKCPLCFKTFSNNNDIPRHIYAHISGSYKVSDKSICYVCLKELPTGVSMQQHINVEHKLANALYGCKICEEKFRSEEDLTIHMWDLHNARETPYRCGVCGFGTAFHHEVVNHFMESHPTCPQAQCPLCLKQFGVSSPQSLKLLLTHFQSHSAATNRKAKPCPRCTLTFLTETDLDNHLMYHFPNEISSTWQPYPIPNGEIPLPMGQPPLTKTPIQLSMSNNASYASSSSSQPPPAKKQKTQFQQQQQKKKDELKKSTLNVSISVPIDTNERYGGSSYAINLPKEFSDLEDGGIECGECGAKGVKQGHFIGKLICTKCRYITSCQSAMDIHHERNHNTNATNQQQIKPIIKTNGIVKLTEEHCCKKCGFSSLNPYLLARHLESKCEAVTVCPKSKFIEMNRADSPPPPTLHAEEPSQKEASSSLSSSSEQAPAPTTSTADTAATTYPLVTPTSPVITSFEDMLSLDTGLDSAFSIPSLLATSPTHGNNPNPAPFHSPTFGEPQTPCPPQPSGSNNANPDAQLGDWDGWANCFSSLISK